MGAERRQSSIKEILFIRDEKPKAGLHLLRSIRIYCRSACYCRVALILPRHPLMDKGVSSYTLQDVSASVMAMMLAAHEAELGTCWVGAFKDGEVSEVLASVICFGLLRLCLWDILQKFQSQHRGCQGRRP